MRAGAALTWLFCAGIISAADASDLHVVLRVEPHPTFTPPFRQEMRVRLAARLRTALDGMTNVSVVDLAELRQTDRLAFWEQAFAQGLDKIDLVESPGPGRTFFVSIRWIDGQYEVRSRMVLGPLNWVSPISRADRSPDREMIARLIQMQLVREFGLAGSPVIVEGDRVTMKFEAAGASDVRLAEWIKPGDIFAVLQMDGRRSTRVPNTFLRANTIVAAGKVECRVESRFQNPLAGWERGGYRAIKLGAASGPARLRVVDSAGRPLDNIAVRLSTTGFQRGDPIRETGVVRHGRFVSTEPFDRLAFASLSAGDRILARVPVEILGDSPVTIELNSNPSAETDSLTDVDLRWLRGRLLESLARLGEENTQLTKTLNELKNARALSQVTQTLARLDDDLPRRINEITGLRDRSQPEVVAELDGFIRDLKSRQAGLERLKRELERITANSASPEADRKRNAIQLALAQAERDADAGDCDKAIAAYEEVLKQAGDWPDARRRLDELKRAWAVHGDSHRVARAFVYDVWAKTSSADDVSRHLPAARKAWAELRTARDKYAARKFHRGLISAAGLVGRRDEELRQNEGDDVVKSRESLKETSEGLRSLLAEVEAALRE